MAVEPTRKQVHIRIQPSLYRALEAVARQEHSSVPQAARLLLEESLERRADSGSKADDTRGADIATLALAGNAFQWLEDEPDLYDDTCGEPL